MGYSKLNPSSEPSIITFSDDSDSSDSDSDGQENLNYLKEICGWAGLGTELPRLHVLASWKKWWKSRGRLRHLTSTPAHRIEKKRVCTLNCQSWWDCLGLVCFNLKTKSRTNFTVLFGLIIYDFLAPFLQVRSNLSSNQLTTSLGLL